MIKLGKLLAVLAMYKFFVFEQLTQNLNFTSGAQVSAIICVAIVALMLSITFVLKK